MSWMKIYIAYYCNLVKFTHIKSRTSKLYDYEFCFTPESPCYFYGKIQTAITLWAAKDKINDDGSTHFHSRFL